MSSPQLAPVSQGAMQLASAFRLQVNITYDQDLAVQPTADWRTVFDMVDFNPGTPEWDKVDTTTYDNADPGTGIVTKSQRKVAQARTASGQRLRIKHGDPAENAGWEALRDGSKLNRLRQVRWFNASDPTENGEQAIVDVTYDRQGGAPTDRGVDAFSLELTGPATPFANPMTAGIVPNATSATPTSTDAASKLVVTIAGTGFAGVTGAAGVKFGALNADHYWVDSDTQITAITPVGTAGAANITVTGPGGADSTPVTHTRT